MQTRGAPTCIRSDYRPEFTASAVYEWLGGVGAGTRYIERGSLLENGNAESFNWKLKDESRDRWASCALLELQALTVLLRQRRQSHSAAHFPGL